MEDKKIWGMDFKTLLMLGWLVQIFAPVAGLVLAIVFMYYFREDGKKEPWLSEGFKHIANFSLVLYILTAAISIAATILMIIPIIGLIISLVLFLGLAVIGIYGLYVYIMGTIEAGKGNIYVPRFTFEIFK